MPEFAFLATDARMCSPNVLGPLLLAIPVGYVLYRVVSGLKRGLPLSGILENGSNPKTGNVWTDAAVLLVIIAFTVGLLVFGPMIAQSMIPK